MPIDVEFLSSGIGLLLTFRSIVTAEEKIAAIKCLLAAPESIKRLRYTLIDAERARIDWSAEELRIIASEDRRVAALASPSLVIAIVTPRDLEFGEARMWQVFVEETGWDTKVFRSSTDAASWLRTKVPEMRLVG